MANFPNSVYAPRTIENRPGVVYDANDTKTLFAEDLEGMQDEIVAIETQLETRGWEALGAQPTLQEDQDPDFVLRFSSDVTSKITLGDRVRFTQNGATVYGIIMAIGAFAGGVMDIVIFGGTDYNVANTTTYPITNFSVSGLKIPQGFPADPLKWTLEATDTASREQSSPTANTWYNIGGLSLSVPIGAWRLIMSANVEIYNGSTPQVRLCLSTANNTCNDAKMSGGGHGASSTFHGLSLFREKNIVNASAQTYYLNAMTPTSGTGTLRIRGDIGTSVIRAICAYL